MELIWDRVKREEWRQLMASAPRAALQQDWDYGAAIAGQGHRLRRGVLRAGRNRALALVQLAERRLVGAFGACMLLRGPVWLAPEQAAECAEPLVTLLRRDLGRSILLWTPEQGGEGNRWQGLRRVMTGYSTIWLDLAPEPAQLRAGLAAKWRNMLVRAEAAAVTVRECAGGSLVDWLIAANEAYRRKVGYRGPEPPFIHALGQVPQAAQSRQVLIAMEGDEPIAGVILQRHGRSATYYVGCTTPRGRELRAHHLLLWRSVLWLRQRGVTSFDLGGVDTVNAPGLARFKLGMGGEVATLAGTYLGTPLPRAVV